MKYFILGIGTIGCLLILGLFVFIMGFETGKNTAMFSAFHHGFAVPVKNGLKIQYEWIDPNLLSLQEPPLKSEETLEPQSVPNQGN